MITVGGGTLQPDDVATENIQDLAVTSSKIQTDLFLSGNPYRNTMASRDVKDLTLPTSDHIHQSRTVTATVVTYTTSGQPVNTIKVILDKVGGSFSSSNVTTDVEIGDVIRYYAHDVQQEWHGCILAIISGNEVRIPSNGYSIKSIITRGFTGGNVGSAFISTITPVK